MDELNVNYALFRLIPQHGGVTGELWLFCHKWGKDHETPAHMPWTLEIKH